MSRHAKNKKKEKKKKELFIQRPQRVQRSTISFLTGRSFQSYSRPLHEKVLGCRLTCAPHEITHRLRRLLRLLCCLVPAAVVDPLPVAKELLSVAQSVERMTSERSSHSFQTHRLVPSAPPQVRVCNGHKSSSDSRGAATSAFSVVNTGPVVIDYGSTVHHHVKDTSGETAPSWLSSTAVSPLSATSSTASQLKLSNWQTFYHLLSFITGTGMLCLPLALVEINWYGVLLLIAAAIVSSYTSKLLVDALDAVRWLRGTSVSFSDLGQECFGAPGKLITSVLVHVSLLISSTGYLTLASWCLVDVLGLQYGTVMVLVAVCVWFQVLVPSLRMLAVLSIVNVAFSFWIESVILGDAMYPLKQIALEHSDFVFVTPDLSNVTMMGKLSYTFSLLLGGLFGHSIIPTLYDAMADPGQCSTVVVRTKLGTTALLYLPVCCLTYAVYGATLQAPVFFNMRNTVVRDLAIVLYTIHLLLSYTITLFPLQRACEQWIVQTSRRSNDRDSPLETTAAHGNLLFTSSSPELCRREQDGPCGGVRTTARVLCRSVVVLLTLVLGYFSAPSTLVIFAWMLIPTALLALVLPCVFYCQLCSEDATKTDRVASVVISVLAIVTACWSLAVIIEC